MDRRTSAVLWILATATALAAACADADPSTAEKPGLGVYIGANWQAARDTPGHRVHVVREKVACARCHGFTDSEIVVSPPTTCGECHAEEASTEHALSQARERFGPGASTDCTVCHQFTPSPSAEPLPLPWDCLRCHATPQQDTPAVVVHSSAECGLCHRPHDQPQVLPSQCDACHEDITTTHASTGKTASQVCTTCHQSQHAKADAARPTCVACHAEQKPRVAKSALFEGGHTECTGCHRPHAYEKERAVACRECHAAVPVLGGGRISEHARCTSCHQPHDVRADASSACVGCHQTQKTDHPVAGASSVCTSCHDAHPASTHAPLARACSSCHQGAASDHGFHGKVACTKCHEPHHFGLETANRNLCAGCHTKEVTLASHVQGHTACADCHAGLPHRPSSAQIPCGHCHAETSKRAVKAHKDCGGCHEPHAGAQHAACRDCHSTQHIGSPAGHRDCRNCHDAHTGSLGGKSCVGCHARDGLLGLHLEPKHGKCTDCHEAHQTQVAQRRSACLGACHADKVDHFPRAANCKGCHLFTGAERAAVGN